MALSQQLLTIGVVILGTMLTRFLPFLLFPQDKPTPPLVHDLGRLLPGGGVCAPGGLLSQECLPHRRKSRNPRGHRHCRGGGAAPVEAPDPYLHRRGHRGLYAPGADGVLSRSPTDRPPENTHAMLPHRRRPCPPPPWQGASEAPG